MDGEREPAKRLNRKAGDVGLRMEIVGVGERHTEALRQRGAHDTFFKGLAASGWQTAAITMRLLVTTGLPLATGIIGASIDLAWPTPTRPGDRLHVELEVTDVRVSKSDPSRGFITAAYDTLNQHGDVRQRTTARLLAFTKPH